MSSSSNSSSSSSSNKTMMGGRVKIDGYRCGRCEHIWVSRTHEEDQQQQQQQLKKYDPSVICPQCKSPYWNKPRVVKNKN